MILQELLDTLENGATKLNIVDKQGVVLVMSVWFDDIDKKLLKKRVKKLQVKDYTINIFL